MGVGARSNVLVSLHTLFFSLFQSGKPSMGIHWNTLTLFFSCADFSVDLQNDTESKHSI